MKQKSSVEKQLRSTVVIQAVWLGVTVWLVTLCYMETGQGGMELLQWELFGYTTCLILPLWFEIRGLCLVAPTILEQEFRGEDSVWRKNIASEIILLSLGGGCLFSMASFCYFRWVFNYLPGAVILAPTARGVHPLIEGVAIVYAVVLFVHCCAALYFAIFMVFARKWMTLRWSIVMVAVTLGTAYFFLAH